jgi:hypothetical protein
MGLEKSYFKYKNTKERFLHTMTQDDTKLKEIIEFLNSLPEGTEIPDEILNELTQDQMVAVFVEQMISDKGVVATDELRLNLYQKLSDEITKNMILAMPDYLVEKLNKDIEQGANEEVIEKAIDESGIDVETITEQTMTKFREEYLNQEEK